MSNERHDPHRARRRRHRTAALIAIVAVSVLGACSSSQDDASEGALFEAPASQADRDTADAGDVETPGTPPPAAATAGFDLGTIGRQMIVEMRVTMVSADLRATVEGITRAASSRGGGIASTDVDFGSVDDEGRPRGDGFAVIVAKVPPDTLDEFLAGVGRLGEVVSIGQDAQDVTDQLTDLDVRITNARASVERVRALLTEAVDLREVIELESELTRRQTDLERLEATKRNLADRVALSTVTITVYTEAPDPEVIAARGDGVGDAFARGLEMFGAAVVAVAIALALAAPFLALAAVVALVVWIVVRRRRRDEAVIELPDPPAADATPSS